MWIAHTSQLEMLMLIIQAPCFQVEDYPIHLNITLKRETIRNSVVVHRKKRLLSKSDDSTFTNVIKTEKSGQKQNAIIR